MFASKAPVAGLDADTLPMVFFEVRQLLDLFMGWDFTTYLAEYSQQRNATYSRVTPNNAALLLDKLFEHEKRKSSKTKVVDKDRKKLIETILKQLRSLS